MYISRNWTCYECLHASKFRNNLFARRILIKAGRVSQVQPEIGFVLKREKNAGELIDLLNKRRLPYRVTHNDTKLNNIMIDDMTEEAICVIDLDTVM